MTVGELYERYRLMPILQMHQLRVAAVGKTICDHFDQRLDAQAVVLACLFHDMGNIIKSDFDVFPAALAPLGREHWEQVKKEYIEKYGSNEHVATIAIAREISLSDTAIALIDGVGFSHMKETRDNGPFELKIVEYSDSRVSPQGITSMDARLADARKRYAHVIDNSDITRMPEQYDELLSAAHGIEDQIFLHTDIRPDELTEEVLRPLAESLREYKVA